MCYTLQKLGGLGRLSLLTLQWVVSEYIEFAIRIIRERNGQVSPIVEQVNKT